jgi:hypothetical protein
MTRDEWLYAIANELTPIFTEAGASFSTKMRIVCAIDDEHWGKCFPRRNDNITLILVSPRIKKPIDAAAVLVHELVHAAMGSGHGHGETFRTLALRVGLTDPTQPHNWWSAGPELVKRLKSLVRRVGPYPDSDFIEIDRSSFAAHIGPEQVSDTVQIDRASFAARAAAPKPPPPAPPTPQIPAVHDYPRMLFHPTLPPVTVTCREEEDALGSDWSRRYQPPPPPPPQPRDPSLPLPWQPYRKPAAPSAVAPVGSLANYIRTPVSQQAAAAISTWQELAERLGYSCIGDRLILRKK